MKRGTRLILCLAGVLASSSVSAAQQARPRLVLQIVVDQLRGDMLTSDPDLFD